MKILRPENFNDSFISHVSHCTIIIAPTHASTPFENDEERGLSDDGLELCEEVCDQYCDFVDELANRFGEPHLVTGNALYCSLTLHELFRGTYNEISKDARLSPPCNFDLRMLDPDWYHKMKDKGLKLHDIIRQGFEKRERFLFGEKFDNFFNIAMDAAVKDHRATFKIMCLREPLPSWYLLSRNKTTVSLGLQVCQAFVIYHDCSRICWVDRVHPIVNHESMRGRAGFQLALERATA